MRAERNYCYGYLKWQAEAIVIILTINFWQQNNQPIELTSNEFIDQKLNYIHNNPVEAGIVLSPEDYLYSSAINYANGPEKLIDVNLI
jgi:hypothetical protein